jgi:hypothetical protein
MTFSEAGAAGMASETGGNGTGGGSGETGGTGTETGGSGTCVPKTCLTLAVELDTTWDGTGTSPDACGLLDDGCGNLIDCGGCAAGWGCGVGTLLYDENFSAGAAPEQIRISTDDNFVPNICRNSCKSYGTNSTSCSVDRPYVWVCNDTTTVLAPKNDCVNLKDMTFHMDVPNIWCCPE